MKRSSSSSRSRLARPSKRPARRVLDSPPIVYLGPDALPALEKGSGLLLGTQRPGWVDAVYYDSLPGMSWQQLVKARFNHGYDWDVVGVVLRHQELEERRDVLVSELVPGDVVLGLKETDSQALAYVNLGDKIVPTRLKLTRPGRSTSARSRHRRRYSRSSR